MTILFLLSAIIAAIFTGIHEAIVNVKPLDAQHERDYYWDSDTFYKLCSSDPYYQMIREFDIGPRGHVWHKYYHVFHINWVALVGYGVLLPHQSWRVIVLSLLLAWCLFEFSYNKARWGTWENEYGESVNFFDVNVKVPWYSKYALPRKSMEQSNKYWVTGWHWIQIHPFHAPSRTMHIIRVMLVAIAGIIVLRREK